ncbi:hypothetical protein BDP27DRAFT_1453615 [Rhodocollybia butyracea]|uniref:Uncharacterized protein n=1 Tax=Rhodocollybia butyracea TaxID=206335 RepID=A0A9P5P8S6_9AGAR|nr:hypothetical protein BDP27DRAFT_1453615 [Rhodocollybia butyracea]
MSSSNDGAVAVPAADLDGLDDFEMASQTLGVSMPTVLEQTVSNKLRSLKPAKIGEIIEDDDEDVDSNFAVVIDSDPHRTYYSSLKIPDLSNGTSNTTTRTHAFPRRQVRKIRIHQPLPLRTSFHNYVPPAPLTGPIDNTHCQSSRRNRPQEATPVLTPTLSQHLPHSADSSIVTGAGRNAQCDFPHYNPSFGDGVFRLKKVSQSSHPGSFNNALGVPGSSNPEAFFVPTKSYQTQTQHSRCTMIPERVSSPLSTAPPNISRFTRLEAPNPNSILPNPNPSPRTGVNSPGRTGRTSRAQRDIAIRNHRNALAEQILAERKMREHAQRGARAVRAEIAELPGRPPWQTEQVFC